MLVGAELERRFGDLVRDENGDIWMLREAIDLPFECHRSCFDKYGKVLQTYLHRTNAAGYVWAYFWVLSTKVDLKDPVSRIVGDDQNNDHKSHHTSGPRQHSDESTIESGGFLSESDSESDEDAVMDVDCSERSRKQDDKNHTGSNNCLQDPKPLTPEERVAQLEREALQMLDKAVELEKEKEEAMLRIELLEENQQTLMDQVEQHKSEQEELKSLKETKMVLEAELKKEQNLRVALDAEASKEVKRLKEEERRLSDEVAHLMDAVKKEYDLQEAAENELKKESQIKQAAQEQKTSDDVG